MAFKSKNSVKSMTSYRILRRPEAQMLATWARAEKKMALPNGWLTFYRLTPEQITKRFPEISVADVVREARLQVPAKVEA